MVWVTCERDSLDTSSPVRTSNDENGFSRGLNPTGFDIAMLQPCRDVIQDGLSAIEMFQKLRELDRIFDGDV
jgi:hypothetical protein